MRLRHAPSRIKGELKMADPKDAARLRLGLPMEKGPGFLRGPGDRAEQSSAASHAFVMETLRGFPFLPALVRAEQSSAASHAFVNCVYSFAAIIEASSTVRLL